MVGQNIENENLQTQLLYLREMLQQAEPNHDRMQNSGWSEYVVNAYLGEKKDPTSPVL